MNLIFTCSVQQKSQFLNYLIDVQYNQNNTNLYVKIFDKCNISKSSKLIKI